MIKKISKLHPCHLGAHDTKTEDVDPLANGEHPISNREMSMKEPLCPLILKVTLMDPPTEGTVCRHKPTFLQPKERKFWIS